jgi:hypothetical protein
MLLVSSAVVLGCVEIAWDLLVGILSRFKVIFAVNKELSIPSVPHTMIVSSLGWSHSSSR